MNFIRINILRINILIRVSLIFWVLLLTSCSVSQDSGDRVSSIEVYLVKPAFGVELYEQYKVDGGLLYYECGTSDVTRQIVDAGYSSMALTDTFLRSLQDLLELENHEWVKRERGNSLINLGETSIRVLGDFDISIRTSLSHVAYPSDAKYQQLRDFVSAVRLMVPHGSCPYRHFF